MKELTCPDPLSAAVAEAPTRGRRWGKSATGPPAKWKTFARCSFRRGIAGWECPTAQLGARTPLETGGPGGTGHPWAGRCSHPPAPTPSGTLAGRWNRRTTSRAWRSRAGPGRSSRGCGGTWHAASSRCWCRRGNTPSAGALQSRRRTGNQQVRHWYRPIARSAIESLTMAGEGG